MGQDYGARLLFGSRVVFEMFRMPFKYLNVQAMSMILNMIPRTKLRILKLCTTSEIGKKPV